MISIKDALNAAGFSESIKAASHIGKYRVIDSSGLFLAYMTWENIEKQYNIKQALIDGRTETLPYGLKKPNESITEVKLIPLNLSALSDIPNEDLKEIFLQKKEVIVHELPKNISSPSKLIDTVTLSDDNHNQEHQSALPFETIHRTRLNLGPINYEVYDSENNLLGKMSWRTALKSYEFLKSLRRGRKDSLPKDAKTPGPKVSKIVLVPFSEEEINKVTDKELYSIGLSHSQLDKLRKKLFPEESDLIKEKNVDAVQRNTSSKRNYKNNSSKVHVTKIAVTPDTTSKEESAEYKTKSMDLDFQFSVTATTNKQDCEYLYTALKQYAEDIRTEIKNLWFSSGISARISKEINLHKERYSMISQYNKIERKLYALYNISVHKQDDIIESLLKKAHLFICTDDELWFTALEFKKELTELPYEVCLVENVIFCRNENSFDIYRLAETANIDRAKKLLSFIVNKSTQVVYENQDNYFENNSSSKSFPEHYSQDQNLVSYVILKDRAKDAKHIIRSTRKHKLTHSFSRRGHWRNQACGEGRKNHKRVWISETIVTPSGEKYKISDLNRVHEVRYIDSMDSS